MKPLRFLHKIMKKFFLIVTGLIVIAVSCWAGFLVPDIEPTSFLEYYWMFLFNSCALVAILYFLATLFNKSYFWAFLSGLGAGIGANIFMEIMTPTAGIFHPLMDSSITGNANEKFIWLIINSLICFGIAAKSAHRYWKTKV